MEHDPKELLDLLFFSNTMGNAWVRLNRWVEIYVRIQYRFGEHPGMHFTIANISTDAMLRYKSFMLRVAVGVELKEWCESIERACNAFYPVQGIYVENVLTPEMERFFIRLGYTQTLDSAPECPCYFKVCEQVK